MDRGFNFKGHDLPLCDVIRPQRFFQNLLVVVVFYNCRSSRVDSKLIILRCETHSLTLWFYKVKEISSSDLNQYYTKPLRYFGGGAVYLNVIVVQRRTAGLQINEHDHTETANVEERLGTYLPKCNFYESVQHPRIETIYWIIVDIWDNLIMDL